MAILSLLVIPWQAMIRETASSTVARALADDLLLETVSEPGADEALLSAEEHAQAVEATAAYVHAAGSRLAPDKCLSTSTNAQVRAQLRQEVYPTLGASFKVVTDFRDLGSHINLSAKN
eukprot:27474-Alexandrium_andersonii.AAC.1